MTLQMVLNDGTTIDLEEASLTKHFVVSCATDEDFVSLWQKMTPENLSEVQILEDGNTTQVIEGMTLAGTQTVEDTENNRVIGHFYMDGGTYQNQEYIQAAKIMLGESE